MVCFILIKINKNRGKRKQKVSRFGCVSDEVSIEEDEDENNVYVVSKLFFFCYGLGMILILCFLFGNCWVYKFGLKNNELMMLEGDLI